MPELARRANLMLEMTRERGVSEMATTATRVKVAERVQLKPFSPTPRVAEVVPVSEPVAIREELPLEVRLKRQREIIHARRGELKRFLHTRGTTFAPPWSTLPTVALVPPEAPSAGQEMLGLQSRLKRQREIIHSRRGEMKRFLSPR